VLKLQIGIIGGGKASCYHLMAYAQLKKKIDFTISFLIEPNQKNANDWLNLYSELFDYSKLPEVFSDLNEIHTLDDMILDICSPNNTHLDVIKLCKTKGAKKFIVEKPAFVNYKELNEFKNLEGITVYIQENYIFSTLLKTVEDILKQYQIKINQIDMNFSKNRINDSLMNRGFYNGVPPHIFMIEIPHTVAIAHYLLGPGTVVHSECEDMSIGNKHFNNHGKGSVLIKHEFATSNHYSSMVCQDRQRSFIINGADNDNNLYSITVHFPHDYKNLIGTIELHVNNNKTNYYELVDNSLANSIDNILLAFAENQDAIVNKDFIIQTSQLLFDAIDKSFKSVFQ